VRTTGLKGALALVSVPSGACPDLRSTARALKTAGAVGVVAYAGHGQSCSGSLGGQPVIPVLPLRAVDAPCVLAHRTGNARLARPAGRARLAPRSSPQYVYDLVGGWDSVPQGAVVDGRAGHVATMVEHVRSMGGTSAAGLGTYDHFVGWLPGLGKAAFGLLRR